MEDELLAAYYDAIDLYKASQGKKPVEKQVPERLPAKLPTQQREIVESYKLAFGRNAYGLYAQRAKLVLIEALQDYIKGLRFRDGGCVKYDTTVDENLFGERSISFDIRRICPEGVTNFREVREQLVEMLTLHFEYEDGERFRGVNFFQEVVAEKGSWTATFYTTKAIWEVFMDFSKGYRKVELATAMKFRSVYALRFYEKVVGQTDPVTYTIDELRAMFQLQKKYKKPTDFVIKVVQAAKDELDEVSPWSFDYTQNFKAEGPGRPSLHSVTLIPLRLPRNESDGSNTYRRNISVTEILSKESLNYLMHTLGFSKKEITNNFFLFEAAEKHLELPEFLHKIGPRALRVKKPKGYTIKAIQKELKESAHIVL